MIDHYLKIALDFLHHNPHWGGAIAFFLAFIESFPVLGSIVPGTLTMTMIGAAMGAGVLPIPSTLLWTLSGAFIGDSSGYLLGRYFQDRITTLWPFTRRPQWLASGRNFFAKHGGKSIFMGFYMGPLRSMMPLIAGMLNFPSWRFFIAIIPSACVWASLYTIPGFLLGKFSLTLPPKIAAQLILFVLVSIIFLWLLIWCINHVFSRIWAVIDYFFYTVWAHLSRQHWFYPVNVLLRDKQNPQDHHQFLRLFFIVLFFILFTATMLNIMAGGVITHFNEPVYFLLRSLRNETATSFMIAITLFSDKHVMWAASLLIAAWLIKNKQLRTAGYLLGSTLITTATVLIFKHAIPSLRPPEPYSPVSTHSLPSGHTTLSVVLLIFLSTLLSSSLPQHRKKIPFYCLTLIIILIATSRLYLGAHWLSDIVASLLLAIFYALVALLFYCRKHRTPLPFLKLLTVIILSLGTSWVANSLYNYNAMVKIYAHSNSLTFTIENKLWWEQKQKNIPLYRENRFGKPVEAFNIQWATPLQDIKEKLITQGWKDHSNDTSFSATLSAIADKSPLRYLSLFPKLYQNRPPAALLSFGDTNPFLILQLWECSIILNNIALKNNSPLWVGTVYYYKKSKSKTTPNPIQSILFFLKKDESKLITIPKAEQPDALQKNWDGHVLLIKDKK